MKKNVLSNSAKLLIGIAILGLASLIIFGTNLFGSKPKVSIITSVWKGDLFIEGFMEDITKQTIFPKAELIIINANSPGNEEPVIQKYLDKYKNIRYVKLEKDPGLYAVWNIAIKMAQADYITNANIDDRSKADAIEQQVAYLDEHPEYELVYSGYLITQQPNETMDDHHARWYCDSPEFSIKGMMNCLPGPRPVWRKAVHEKCGYFDETFTSAGDLEMWLRAVDKGSEFKKIPGFLTLFYLNPEGISTNKDVEKAKLRIEENKKIYAIYNHLWDKDKQ